MIALVVVLPGDKVEGKASVHSSGAASVVSADDRVGGSGAVNEPSPDLNAESDVGDVHEGGAGSTSGLGRDGLSDSLDGAAVGEGGAGSATGVGAHGARTSRGGGVGGDESGRTHDGGTTPTVSDEDGHVDFDDNDGSEGSSDEDSPGERDRAKHGCTSAYNPAQA